jgi:hypothetical protein
MSVSRVVPDSVRTDPAIREPASFKLALLELEQQANQGNVDALWRSQLFMQYQVWKDWLSKRELGQLKTLRRLLGDQTYDVIHYIFLHWSEFTFAVRTGRSHATVPAIPHTGFLLKHYAIAVVLTKQAVTP